MPLTVKSASLIATLVFAASPGQAQTNLSTQEIVEFDSPEGWAMAYMTASSLNLGQMPPRSTSLGDFVFSAELGSIPALNEDQQQVGFGGFKDEDLNKSPVFGRARASLGLIWDVTAELSYTPPLKIDGAKPDGLWGIALSRPLLDLGDWGFGLRVFAQEGEVRADVTCSAEVATQPPQTVANPFGCTAPSNDRMVMDHYGAEVIFSLVELPLGIRPWVSLAVTRMDPFVQLEAQLLGSLDLSTLDSKGTTETVSVGLVYRVNDSWRINVASSYTPLDVNRPPGNPGGQDNFWNLRLGLAWDF
ncbi:MAG: hypothetical protein PsegKO_19170 [Pseudohongiellaceae bacterium]